MSEPLQVGDQVCLGETPTQTGVVTRIGSLGVKDSCIVTMHAGPLYKEGDIRAYFGRDECSKLEKMP